MQVTDFFCVLVDYSEENNCSSNDLDEFSEENEMVGAGMVKRKSDVEGVNY
jgi:hypothetical protein